MEQYAHAYPIFHVVYSASCSVHRDGLTDGSIQNNYEGVSKSFLTESVKKYALTTINTS
jgi:hypothetical protein